MPKPRAISHAATTRLVVGGALVCLLPALMCCRPVSTQYEAPPPLSFEGLPQNDRQATELLIAMTYNPALLAENFEALLANPPTVSERYDDEMLVEEYKRRFSSRAAPWNTLPTPRAQLLWWLAEYNKRLCFDRPKERSRHREALLAAAKEDLTRASDPAQIQTLLGAAMATVFYGGQIIPRDGGDPVIDLFKTYVGHQDRSVHDYACEQLRYMGFVWRRTRYDEILQFLIENAPELRAQLTADIPQGVNADLLSGYGTSSGASEGKYLAIDSMSADELKHIVQETVERERARWSDLLGHCAFARLVASSRQEYGGEALDAVIDLTRRGIQPGSFLYYHGLKQPGEDSETTLRRFEKVLDAFLEAAKTDWPSYELHPSHALKHIRETLRKEYADELESPAFLRVDERLQAALAAVGSDGQ